MQSEDDEQRNERTPELATDKRYGVCEEEKENNMNINWKLRLQNKTTLTAIIVTVVAIVYKCFDLAGCAIPVPEAEVLEVAELVVLLLGMLGIVVDPTTNGVSDSARAMQYNAPAGDGE